MRKMGGAVPGCKLAGRVLLQIVLLATLAACAPSQVARHTADVATGSPDTHAGTARKQVHRTWAFPADGITFSNRMTGARLNGVERLGEDHYAVTISPESLPINPSPWYGFSITARQATTVAVEFRYRHGRQRYRPKLSTDGTHWRTASNGEFAKGRDGRYTLTVAVGASPLQVFAQPPWGPSDFEHWESGLQSAHDVHADIIGRSVQGRPLRMLRFGNPDAKDVVLVIGRQHPPEITGSHALMGFVDRLLSDTALAREFRSRTWVLVVPLMNPDGVVEGHWRGNADGKDINRDWGTFTEPETRAVRDAMTRQIDAAGRRLAFAIDFHSTWSDVFYTVKEAPSRQPGGVLRRWIDAMQAQYPGRIREKANAAKGTVFKNWAFRRYHAPTVTYEVGDKTSNEQIDDLAGFAAERLMQILLDDRGDTR